MEFNDLKLFLNLCETRNFAKTANQNHMSPSTLSRQIQRIEAELGVSLFVRDNRQVDLTEAGQAFISFAQKGWADWQSMKLQLRYQAEQQLSGELRLFCSVTAAYSHLPQILEKFRRLYPKVEIKLTTGDPALALSLVQNQEVDLALAGQPKNLPQGMIFHYIDSISLSLIAPRVACLATQKLQQKNVDWQSIPFILPVEGPARQRIDLWFKQQKMKHPLIYATVAGHEAIVSMVALGCGVAMLPDVVIKNSPMHSQITYIDLKSPITPFELGFCVQKKSLNKPLVRAFWQTLE